MTTFLATLTPMLTLFLCIGIGFIFSKCKILPEGSSKVLAKTETWIFCPALSFMTMARFCTVDSIGEHFVNLILSVIGVIFAVAMAILLTRFFVRDKSSSDWGVYAYALAFANSGYMGDPIVLALFGEEALSYYKLFGLPIQLMIYSWGIGVMTPKGEKGGFLRRMINAPTVSMLVGVAVGLSGLGKYLPEFIVGALDALKACMGPVAMLLAGVTIAKYDFLSMLKKKKVYVATVLRLVVLPSLIIALLFGLKTLANAAWNLSIGNDALFLTFFATATPLGLNTVVFPEAYGGNPETGASMTMISHTLCVLSIPVMYALMVALFGVPFMG